MSASSEYRKLIVGDASGYLIRGKSARKTIEGQILLR